MLTFESASVLGTSSIVEKLVVGFARFTLFRETSVKATCLPIAMLTLPRAYQGLPFQKVKHQVSTLDAQPSNDAGGIIILVTGQLLVRLN